MEIFSGGITRCNGHNLDEITTSTSLEMIVNKGNNVQMGFSQVDVDESFCPESSVP
jgi:hypothetical protein